jgi:alpha-tubulin suppressor-like RCC1 family protein
MSRTSMLGLSVSVSVVAAVACGSNSGVANGPGTDGGLDSSSSSGGGSGSGSGGSSGSSSGSSSSGSSSGGFDAGACGGDAGASTALFAIAGYNASAQVDTDTSIFAWGYNVALGTGNLSYQLTPAEVPGCGWVKLALGDSHTLAVKKDGTLWSWGENELGQLGYANNEQNVTLPAQVGLDTNWASVAAGAEYSLAIKTDGTLWAWGDDKYGQLGLGTIQGAQAQTPTQVGTDTNWATVSANYTGTLTLATKTDGTLWAWGSDSYGQLGDGASASSPCDGNAASPYCMFSPEQIGTDTNWVFVSAGEDYAEAIKTDGTLWGWGADGNGEIGDGSYGTDACSASGETSCINAPVQVGAATNWASVSAGTGTTLGVQKDGSLWGWGYNLHGAVGDGTNTGAPCGGPTTDATYCVLNPERIGTDTNWAGVSSGDDQTIGWKTDGSVWGWGGDPDGEVGNGVKSTTGVFAPVQVD